MLRSKYPSIPVMILASQPTLDAAFEAAQLGAVDYVPASLDNQTLNNRVENAIRQENAIPPEPELSLLPQAKRRHRDDSVLPGGKQRARREI
jgi:DNA-binding NarL/FixJ family response regulator